MKTISYKLKDLDQKEKKVTLKLGYVGENEHVQIRIDCSEIWENYPNAVASLAVEPPEGSKYPAIVTREGNIVCWTVKDSDVVHDGDGRIQLTFTEGSEIQKTVICRTKVDESIIGSGTAPDPIADFVSEANEALAELEAAEVHGPVIGEDGYWYTWNKDAGEYVKTDTKAQGEDGQQGPAGKDGADGAPGQDGHTPVKGTDYWTQQDQADIVAAAALETVSAVIDDTAGDGDTNKTWSADKIADVTGQLLNAIQGVEDEIDTILVEEPSSNIFDKSVGFTTGYNSPSSSSALPVATLEPMKDSTGSNRALMNKAFPVDKTKKYAFPSSFAGRITMYTTTKTTVGGVECYAYQGQNGNSNMTNKGNYYLWTPDGSVGFVAVSLWKAGGVTQDYVNGFMIIEVDDEETFTWPSEYIPFGGKKVILSSMLDYDVQEKDQELENRINAIVSGGTQAHYVKYDGTDIYIKSHYNSDEDIVVKLVIGGANDLPNPGRIFTVAKTGDGIDDDLTPSRYLLNRYTDWFAPHQVAAVSNADGDVPNTVVWCGGNHQSNNSSSGGYPTGFLTDFHVMCDGTELIDGDDAFCNSIEIVFTEEICGYNTWKSNKTGRRVLIDNIRISMGETARMNCEIINTATEDVKRLHYYGLMAVVDDFDVGAQYLGGANRGTYPVEEGSSCGNLTCRNGRFKTSDGDIFLTHMDEVDLGSFAYSKDRDYSYFVTASATKAYWSLISNTGTYETVFNQSEGEQTCCRGWYDWVFNPADVET